VICLDLEVVKFVEDIGAPGRVELVANPIVMDEQSGAADETNEIVLFAGEVGLRKGVDVLASAWNMVAPEHPDARLLIAGPPTDLIVSPAERLEMLGPQSPAAVRELIRQARVIALPSRAEGMPMVLTEAMSAGRPFVGTPVGAVAELAEHGGCLAAVGDDLALASRLKEFLADPGRARSVGERGRTYCAATRSVEVIDRQMRGHYAKAAELAAKS
jgi:glycosyltransferase involved in cell wall biosynthesis